MVENSNSRDRFAPCVAFFSESDYAAELFLPVAEAMRTLRPDFKCVLVDTSALWAATEHMGSAPVFEESGFAASKLSIPVDVAKGDRRLGLLLAIQQTLSDLSPKVAIVPHELGYAFDVVQVANLIGIPTYHLQHGIWGPEVVGGEPPLVAARRDFSSPENGSASQAAKFSRKQSRILRQEWELWQAVWRALRCRRWVQGNRVSAPPELTQLLARFSSEKVYRCSVTKIGATGPYYKRRFEAMGIPADRVDVVGYLRTDCFFEQPIESYESLCALYDLDPSHPLALYFYAPFGTSVTYQLVNSDPIEAILDAIHCLHAVEPEINVLVLNHPLGNMAQLQDAVGQLNMNNVRVGRAERNHWSLYHAATITIGVYSSTLAEAALAGRPIVTQNYVLYDPGLTQLIEGGAAIPVFHRIHLQGQIERALKDRPFIERVIANQAHVAHDLMGPFDGKCGERAARSILRLAGVQDV